MSSQPPEAPRIPGLQVNPGTGNHHGRGHRAGQQGFQTRVRAPHTLEGTRSPKGSQTDSRGGPVPRVRAHLPPRTRAPTQTPLTQHSRRPPPTHGDPGPSRRLQGPSSPPAPRETRLSSDRWQWGLPRTAHRPHPGPLCHHTPQGHTTGPPLALSVSLCKSGAQSPEPARTLRGHHPTTVPRSPRRRRPPAAALR